MPRIDTHTPLGQLVAGRPRRARVLNQLGLDCRAAWRKPLDQACAESHLDVEAVAEQLATSEVQNQGAADEGLCDMPLQEFVEQIAQTHHRFVREELPRLAGLLCRVVETHAERHPELWEVVRVFSELRTELLPHVDTEERIVFPIIVRFEQEQGMRRARMPWGSLGTLMRMMEQDHSRALGQLDRIRSLTGGFAPPEDADPAYTALLEGFAALDDDLRKHMALEDDVLFARAALLESETSST